MESSEIRISRNGRLAAFAAGITALVSTAYFVRAAGEGRAVDWVVFVVLGALLAFHLRALRDARTPLLVADRHGVRMRFGRTWRGAPWADLEEVEHLPRRGRLRDGRVVLFPRRPDDLLTGLGRRARWNVALSRHLYRSPFALPLGLTTTVSGAAADLTDSLARLAGERCDVVEIVPGLDDEVADQVAPDLDDVVDPMHATVRLHDADPTSPTQTLLVPDLADLPLVDPVIGPVLRAARERLRLSIDQLSERTRIRPHVLEALEIDDFVPCGGDFYARGHLRTLARVLGVDAEPLLATYQERYADAPIDPLRVFEADLAGRRGAAAPRRPAGSVLVAAVMATVLVWSVARLLMDTPVTVAPVTPSLANGSAGLSNGASLGPAVPVSLTAAGGGAHVVVRDGSGKVVFKDSIPFGVTQSLEVRPPVRVQSSDGSLVVVVDGIEHGAMGETGRIAQDVYTAR